MTSRDGKEILRWAFLSGVLVFAAMGVRVASSDQPQASAFNSAETTVNGVRYKLEQVSSNVPHVVKVKVTVENQTSEACETEMTLKLVSSVYNGRSGGRVASPGDFQETLHDRMKAHETIAPSAVRVFPAGLKAKPVTGSPRWTVKLGEGGNDILVIALKPG